MVKDMNEFNSKYSVGIIGCGWLGKALAQMLIKQNITVLATSSKQENVDKLNLQSINTQQLVLPTDAAILARHDVFTMQSLVIAITPQLRQGRVDYAEKIAQLVNTAQQVGVVERIILLSSTAVYDGLDGDVDEDSVLNLTIEKVKILNAAEQAVLSFSKHQPASAAKQGIVLRLAGLVGPDRHPGKFILANKMLSNAMAPVNLIHQQDAVGLIAALLEQTVAPAIFTGVSDTHVTKAEYYQVAAKSLGLKPPAVEQQNKNEATKMVLGDKTQRALGYQFFYPDLLAWLNT